MRRDGRRKFNVETLRTPPKAPDNAIPKEHIPITGDGQGNALYIIYQLVLQGVIHLPDGAYDRLQQLYFQEEEFLPANLAEFIGIMQDAITAEHLDKTIILDGDLFFDRGRNCLLMIKLLVHLQSLGIHTIINFSNHDFWLYEYLFADDIREHLYGYAFDLFFKVVDAEFPIDDGIDHDGFAVYSGVPTRAEEVIEEARRRTDIYMERLHIQPGNLCRDAEEGQQGRSGLNLQKMIESDEFETVTKEHVRQLVIKHILPCCELVSAVYDKTESTLVTSTHARVANETFREAAKSLGVEYDDHSPEAYVDTLNRINIAWRTQCLRPKPSIIPPRELAVIYNDREGGMSLVTDPACLPVYRIGHTRCGASRSVYTTDKTALLGLTKGEATPTGLFSDQLLDPTRQLKVPESAEERREQLQGELEWQKTVVMRCHGHESFLETPEQLVAFQGARDRAEIDQLREEFISANPFQSPLQAPDEAVWVLAAHSQYASHDFVNLDSSTLGREGHPNSRDVTPTVYHLEATGVTLTPVPNHIQESRKAAFKQRRKEAKVLLLRMIMRGCHTRLTKLSEQLRGSLNLNQAEAVHQQLIHCLGQLVVPSMTALAKNLDDISDDELEDCVKNFEACLAFIDHVPVHPWNKSIYKNYSCFKRIVNNSMELPYSQSRDFINSHEFAIFGEQPDDAEYRLGAQIGLSPSIWVTPTEESEAPAELVKLAGIY